MTQSQPRTPEARIPALHPVPPGHAETLTTGTSHAGAVPSSAVTAVWTTPRLTTRGLPGLHARPGPEKEGGREDTRPEAAEAGLTTSRRGRRQSKKKTTRPLPVRGKTTDGHPGLTKDPLQVCKITKPTTDPGYTPGDH